MFNLKEFLGLNFYISELDQYLTHFDREHPEGSLSQLQEKKKYQRIYHLRDNRGQPISTKETFWDNF